MNACSDPNYIIEKKAVFDELGAILAPSMADIQSDAVLLIREGILHLKEGAPNGNPGSLIGAVEKSNLRRSSLAASLGIQPPKFEAAPLSVIYPDGKSDAVQTALRLLETIEGDLPKSRDIIRRRLLSDAQLRKSQLYRHFTDTLNILADDYQQNCRLLRDKILTL